ncbi:MAG: hypothetical protein AAGF54_08200 [Pseudomonadota bacterium]
MDANITESEIRFKLHRLTSSEPLKSSPQLVAFLTYVVEQVLAGNEAKIKAYTIAVDALNRPESFDPMLDPLVRVLATRLRRILDGYYSADGSDDEIRIHLPKGTYVPTILRRSEDAAQSRASASASLSKQGSATGVTEAGSTSRSSFYNPKTLTSLIAFVLIAFLGLNWLFPDQSGSSNSTPKAAINSVGITPIRHDPEDAQQVRISSSIEEGLARTLQNGSFLSVKRFDGSRDAGSNLSQEIADKQDVRFVVAGYLHPVNSSQTDTVNRLTLSLVYQSTGVILWSEEYEFSRTFGANDYDNLIRNIGYDINPAYYAATKRILSEEGVNQGSAIELFLASNWIPGIAVSSLSWEKERVRLAQEALKINPDFGPAHAVLADKLAYLATVDPPSDTEEKISQSKVHAAKALAFADQQADALYNILSHKLHIGEIKAAERLANRVAEIDPKNVLANFYVKSMGLTCKAATDEELDGVISFHNNLNSRNPARWITATTISRIELNRGNYPEAVSWGRESEKIFQSLGAAFQLAAALVQTGDVSGAQSILEKHRENWPNIDASHFANVVIPRRCGNYEIVGQLQKVYQDLAKATQ